MKARFAAGCSLASGLAVLALLLVTSWAVPASASTITSTFNGTSLADEDIIWIGAPFSASGVGGGPATPYARNPTVILGQVGQIALPNAVIRVLAVHASASFASEAWDVQIAPGSTLGSELLAGVSSLSQGLSRTDFFMDTPSLSLNQAAAPEISSDFMTGGGGSSGASSAGATVTPQIVPAPWGSLVLMGAGLLLVRRRR